MLIDYKSLSDNSKIYIYPSNRKFYSNELLIIDERLKQFFETFEESEISYKIKYGRFIIVFVSDKTPLSIDLNDKLVTFIFSLEKEFKLSLLDKVNVCFKQGEYVQLKEMGEFKKLIKNKGVSKKTIVFDNLIVNKKEFENCWEAPAGESWISHFF